FSSKENIFMAMFLLYVQVFCRSTIVLIFLFSFLGKMRSVVTFQHTVTNFAILPTWLDRPVALLFLLAEALVLVLLLLGGPFLLPGYLFATALLLIFCLGMLSVLIRRISTSCSCFGPSNKPISSIDLVRNVGFMICAVAGCFTLAPPGSGLQ